MILIYIINNYKRTPHRRDPQRKVHLTYITAEDLKQTT